MGEEIYVYTVRLQVEDAGPNWFKLHGISSKFFFDPNTFKPLERVQVIICKEEHANFFLAKERDQNGST